MVLRDHQHHFLVVQRLELQRARDRWAVGDAQIEHALLQALGNHVRGQFVHDHAGLGVALLEARDAVGDEPQIEGMGGTDAQFAFDLARVLAQGAQAAIDLLQGQGGVVQKGFARLGQHHALGRAVEQQHAQFVLELLDLVRQGGLRDVQPFGGAREVERTRQGIEITQMPQLHGGQAPDG